mgnify:CR=1 FL=1
MFGFSAVTGKLRVFGWEEDFEEHYRNNYSNYDTIREVDTVEHYGRRDDDGEENEKFGNIQNNLSLKKVV